MSDDDDAPMADASEAAEASDSDPDLQNQGEAMETRSRHPVDERLGRDALDDAVHPDVVPDDLPADAFDEIAAAQTPEEYPTSEYGDRRPDRDEAEMGLGAEPRSIDELIDHSIGRALPGRRGTTRDDEAHGPFLGEQPPRQVRDRSDNS